MKGDASELDKAEDLFGLDFIKLRLIGEKKTAFTIKLDVRLLLVVLMRK